MEMNYNQWFLTGEGGGGGGVHHDMVHIGLCGLCKFGLKKGVDFDHIGLE